MSRKDERETIDTYLVTATRMLGEAQVAEIEAHIETTAKAVWEIQAADLEPSDEPVHDPGRS
ncbi:MAG: hypothetical protein JSV27_03650 [Candidatus Bathyarchaeota archaeon]|nr:MAG: hypothetical protein JSV27_03650 [Candidatus Bathyarchaeota archaeon]